MKNRAKCKLCNSIIESFHRHDYVSCTCGEISIDGGQDYFRSSAKDYANFLRVDDEGNEIVVTFQTEEKKEAKDPESPAPSRSDKLKMLDDMIKSYENLPPQAIEGFITGYDLVSALILIRSILIDSASSTPLEK